MKDEYIRKQDAIDTFNRAVQDVGILDADDIETVFRMLLSADVVPVRHARWRHYEGMYACEDCGAQLDDESPFCPMCGAKMDGECREE